MIKKYDYLYLYEKLFSADTEAETGLNICFILVVFNKSSIINLIYKLFYLVTICLYIQITCFHDLLKMTKLYFLPFVFVNRKMYIERIMG